MPKALDGGGGRSASGMGSAEMRAPENPSQGSTQIVEEFQVSGFEFPATNAAAAEWDPFRLVEEKVTQRGQEEHREHRVPKLETGNSKLPAPAAQARYRRVETSVGAAQKDTSRELGAKFANMKPVQWVGIALLIGAGALAYFGWWTPAMIACAGGVGLIVMAHAIVGNERLLLILSAVGLGIVVVFRAYDKGKLDSVLPDGLDRVRAGQANEGKVTQSPQRATESPEKTLTT